MWQILVVSMGLFFLPTELFAAQESYTSLFVLEVRELSAVYTTELFDAILTAIYWPVSVLYFGIFTWMFTRILLGLDHNFTAMTLAMTFSIVIVMSFLKDSTAFIAWFYMPVMEMIYNFTGYIIMAASGGKLTGEPTIQNGLNTIYTNLENLRAMSWASWDALDIGMTNFFGKLKDAGTIWFTIACLNILEFAFVIVSTIGIIAANIMVIAMPFALAFVPFTQTRWITKNIFRSFFMYALIPPFAAAAMGFTLVIIADEVEFAKTVLAGGEFVDVITAEVFAKIMLTCIFSFFFVVKSSQFASQVVTGGGSAFGNVFATMGALTAGMAKTVASTKLAGTAAKAGAIGTLKSPARGARGMYQGYGKAKDFVQGKRGGGFQ